LRIACARAVRFADARRPRGSEERIVPVDLVILCRLAGVNRPDGVLELVFDLLEDLSSGPLLSFLLRVVVRVAPDARDDGVLDGVAPINRPTLRVGLVERLEQLPVQIP
jgi:hypothetical protein